VKFRAFAVNLFDRRRSWKNCGPRLPGSLLVLTCLLSCSAADPEPQASRRLHAVLLDGRQIETRPDTDGTLDGRSLSEFRDVSRNATVHDSNGWSPLRLLTLITGESLAIRLRSRCFYRNQPVAGRNQPETSALQVLVAGQPAEIPLRSIRSIAVPDRGRDVFFSEQVRNGKFQQHAVAAESSPSADVRTAGFALFSGQEFRMPSAVGLMELGVVWPSGGSGSLELEFDSGDGFRLRLVDERIWISRTGGLRVAIATPSVSISGTDRRSRLRLTVDSAVILSLDGRVLARGTSPQSSLRSMTVRSQGLTVSRQDKPGPVATKSSGVVAAFGQVPRPVVLSCLIQNRVPHRPRTKFTVTDRISVEMHNGDVLFGNAVDIGPQQVRLYTQSRLDAWDWSEVRHIEFPQQPALQFPRIAGEICRVQLSPEAAAAFFGRQPISAITGAVRITARRVEIEHPIVRSVSPTPGQPVSASVLSLPWASVHRIQPLFRGSYQLIAPETRHLGNTVRNSFSRPVPDGLKWLIHFHLKDSPAGPAWLSLLASGLQPAAPDTLRAWPYRQQLADGFFTTNLTVNGVQAGALNRFCRFPALTGQSVRLRIALPAGSLKSGQNQVELRQRPGPAASLKFLGCELHRIAIELEEPKPE